MNTAEQVALILSNMPVFPALCHINSQRATIVAAQLGIPLLYCEGSVRVWPVTLAHAWNVLDGEVVDFTFMQKKIYPTQDKYKAQLTLDCVDVVNHRKQRKGWVGDPYQYGKVYEVNKHGS